MEQTFLEFGLRVLILMKMLINLKILKDNQRVIEKLEIHYGS